MSLKNSQNQAPYRHELSDKPHLVPVTDPAEREAVLRELETGDITLPIGGWYFGKLYAYAEGLRRWRARNRDGAS